MLIRNKFGLSTIIGVGSVVVLLVIILYFNWAEKKNMMAIKNTTEIAGKFAELDQSFNQFVMAPDSSGAELVRSTLERLPLAIGKLDDDFNKRELAEIAGILITGFDRIEYLALQGENGESRPGTVNELAVYKENLVRSRYVLRDIMTSRADDQVSSIRIQAWLIIVVILPVLLIAIILILVTSSDLISKINGLIADTRKIEEGDFDHRSGLRSDDELGLVSGSVNRMADALNDARLKEQKYRNELLERTRQVNLLKELAIIANRIQNVDELYRIVLERIRIYTGWVSGHIYEVSDDGMVMIPTGIWSVRDEEKSREIKEVTSKTNFMKGEGLIGRVFETGRPVWIANIRDDPSLIRRKAFHPAGIRAVMAFPIIVEGSTHAVFELHSELRDNPDNDMLDLFGGIGAILSHVIVRERYITRINQQAEQLNFAMDSAGMYSWSIDLESNDIQLSRNFKKVLGYLDHSTGTTEEFNRHIHPDDRDEAIKKFNELLNEQKKFSSEYRFFTDTGRELYLWSKGDVIYDADDKPDKVAGIVMDITRRKQIESRLEVSERNYRLLFDSSPLPLWIFTDRSLRIVDSNAMMEKIFGYEKQDLLNYGMHDLIHEDHYESVRESLWNITTRPFTELETRIKTSAGSYLDVVLYTSPIRYMDTDCILATCTDITELKIARKRLLGSIIEGEDRERQRVAVELHDGIGQYLTASNMNLEGLKKDLESISPKKYQQFMNGLVLLNMAIDETRNLAHTLMPKTLKDYGLVISLKSLIDKIKKTAIPDIFFYTSLDEEKLDNQTKINMYRVIQETINNSLKHSKCTKIDVQAVMHERVVVILVEDNGVGFEVQNSIRKNEGIGLLSIRNRVISMNGNIEIDSAQGRGTSITIEIPLSA